MATHSQYSCLEHSKNIGVWWATVHRVKKNQATTEGLTLSLKN